jgi:hypothetical protein
LQDVWGDNRARSAPSAARSDLRIVRKRLKSRLTLLK